MRQQLWCSGVKWDTVVVYMNLVGLNSLQIADDRLQIWPVPAGMCCICRLRTKDTKEPKTTLEIKKRFGAGGKECVNVSLKTAGLKWKRPIFPEGFPAFKSCSRNR